MWWQIADRFPELMRDCEVMVKVLLVYHASLLRVDDVRLKRLPIADKFCTLCDLGSLDDAKHMVLQCPMLQPKRTEMFIEIEALLMRYDYDVNHLDENIFLNLIGKPAADIPQDVMHNVWLISVRYIASMYRMKLRQGIG